MDENDNEEVDVEVVREIEDAHRQVELLKNKLHLLQQSRLARGTRDVLERSKEAVEKLAAELHEELEKLS